MPKHGDMPTADNTGFFQSLFQSIPSRQRDWGRQEVKNRVGQIQKTQPFNQGGLQPNGSIQEGDLFPGEAPIPGLQTVTQKATGLLGGKIKPSEFATGLLSTPGYEQLGSELTKGLLSPRTQANNMKFVEYYNKAGQPQKGFINPMNPTAPPIPVGATKIDQSKASRYKDFKSYKEYLDAQKALTDNYQKNLAPFSAVQDAYMGARSALSGETGMDMVASVIQFMKTLDPNSVVREGEYDQVTDASGLSSKMTILFNKALRGEGLDVRSRNAMAKTLHGLYEARSKKAVRQIGQFKSKAESLGFDETNTLMGLGLSNKKLEPLYFTPPPPVGFKKKVK